MTNTPPQQLVATVSPVDMISRSEKEEGGREVSPHLPYFVYKESCLILAVFQPGLGIGLLQLARRTEGTILEQLLCLTPQ